MKLTAIILLATCLHVSAGVVGQTVTIRVKNAPMKEVFREIQKQTGLDVFVDEALLQKTGKVTLDVKDMPVPEVLNLCLKNEPLNYVISDGRILIRPKPTAVFQSVDTSRHPAPPIEIHGSVVNEKGEPLVGATIRIGELKMAGVTDSKGEFELRGIPNGKYKIEISFVGYDRVIRDIVVIESGLNITVQLRQHTSVLDETVVKGYYSMSNRLNPGNVTVVKGEDIARQPVSDPILALEGRVPGLYVSQLSGVPGASSQILLRGINSIPDPTIKLNTVNNPLFIVDGVPYGSGSLSGDFINSGAAGNPNIGGAGLSPFNNLNPSDIETITVLKDADATAIYGSRGANGVILITTKKGVAGQTRLKFNVYSGTGKATRTIHMLNTPEYLEMRHEGLNNDGLSPNPNYDFDITNWDTTRYTDWQKVLIGNSSKFTNAQLSLSGGNAQTQFLISGTLNNQGTLFPGNYNDRKVSVYTNINSVSPNQLFHAQFSATYVNDINTLPDIDLTGNITLAPDAPTLYDTYGNLNWQDLNGSNTWQNPLSYTNQRDKGATDNLIGNLLLGYRFFKGFDFKVNLGYSHSQLNQTNAYYSNFYPPPLNQNPFSRSLQVGTTDNKSWIVEPQMNYQRKIKTGTLDLLFGTTFQENQSSSILYGGSGYASDNLVTNPAAASAFGLGGYSANQYNYNAFFGRVAYNLDDKYVINLTGRRDGSSRFGPGRQFGNFGALGAAWIFSKESFVEKEINFLSFGKFRGSYGVTGNDGINDFSFLSTYSTQSISYQGVSSLSPTRLSNPFVEWEAVRKLEFGLDLGFLHDRILITGSWYRNRTNNQLVSAKLPTLTGFSSVIVNLPALLQNSGEEFVISTVNVKTNNLNWKSSFNISFPQNKLVAFPDLEGSPYKYNYVLGQSLFIRRVFHYTGVNPQSGLYSFATKNANGIPEAPQDWINSKPVTQKYFGGFLNSFSFKGFQLEVFVQFVKQLGYSILGSFFMPGSFNQNQPLDVLGRWRKVGDVTNIQRFSEFNSSQPYSLRQGADASIIDASFIRLKNISLSYQLPKSWQKTVHLQNASAFINCQNLFSITGYKGLDPETLGLNLPPLRTIVAGIQITL